jgi:hypothetical protein
MVGYWEDPRIVPGDMRGYTERWGLALRSNYRAITSATWGPAPSQGKVLLALARHACEGLVDVDEAARLMVEFLGITLREWAIVRRQELWHADPGNLTDMFEVNPLQFDYMLSGRRGPADQLEVALRIHGIHCNELIAALHRASGSRTHEPATKKTRPRRQHNPINPGPGYTLESFDESSKPGP